MTMVKISVTVVLKHFLGPLVSDTKISATLPQNIKMTSEQPLFAFGGRG